VYQILQLLPAASSNFVYYLPRKKYMTINDYIKLIAGSFVLASIILGYFYSEYFFLFTAFVAVNLIQSSFTKWCLMDKILNKAGVKEGGDSCSI
jgi:hypothetical protein